MISKKLLSEVLNENITRVDPRTTANNELFIENNNGKELDIYINIYELAHKCKEWARLRSFHITSWITMTDVLNGGATVGHSIKDIKEQLIFEDTEPEAIFKACEWIMEQNNEAM